ncbi:hypothetical protein SDC9_145226 [bioreactor metagenome]|uniref:Uncharacterized protein n=1 Tax=bioreactor metagenome TaxID=1076179 RepID=A0A645E9A0_9ZZZZ
MRSDIRVDECLRQRRIGADIGRRDISAAVGIKRNPNDLLHDGIEVDVRAVYRYARANVRRAARGGRPTDQRLVGG